MTNRVSKAHALHVFFALIALAVGLGQPSQLRAQTFQKVPALAFTKVFAGAEPLPQVLTIAYSDQSSTRFSVSASTNSGGSWLSTSPTGAGCCFTPLAVTVSVTAGNLAAGTYTGQVVVTNFSNPNISMTIPVTLTVAATGATVFDDLPGKLSFSFTPSKNPVSQTVQVRNAGSGTLNWTLSASTADGGNWLTPSSGSGTAPSTVTISISKSSLPGGGSVPGTFVGELTFQTSGDIMTIPVAVTVGTAVFTQINPLYFTMPFAGANPLPQVLNIAMSDNSNIRYSASVATAKGGNWLSIAPSGNGCCFTPLANTVSINAGSLPAGAYTGEIVITEFANPGRAMVIPVTLTVAGSGAFFADLPGQLSFSNKTNGATSTAQTIQVGNGGSGSLNWTLATSTADSDSWLTATPSSGTAPSTVTVGVNVSQLPGGGAVPGEYIGQLVFQTAGDWTTIPITVTVGAAAFSQLNPISFTMPFGGANALPQVLNVATIDNSTIRFSGSVATAKGGNWLSISPSGNGCCFTPLAITVSVINANTLPAGTYTAEIIFTEFANPGRSMVVPVNLTIAGSGAFFDTLPGQMSFSLKTGAGTATSQVLQVRNGGSGTLNWTLNITTADGGTWLKSSAAIGTAPSTLSIGIDVTQLPNGGQIAGTFIGELTFVTAGDTSTIPITVTVGTAAFTQTNPISFVMGFGGANPLPQVVTVATTDNSSLRFSASVATSNGGNWLSISPSGAGCCFTPLPLTVSVNAGTLPAGSYTGEIIITEFANPGRSMIVPVSLTVDSAGAFFDDLPGQMNFSTTAGGLVASQILQLGNGGSGKLPWTLTPTTADGGAWLIPSLFSGTTVPKTITIKISPTLLPGAGKIVGTYLGQLLFEASGGFATVQVVVTVGPGAFAQINPISFIMPVGGANPLPQVLSIPTTDNSSIRFSSSVATGKGGNWLQVSTTGAGCCFTPFPLTVSVNGSPLKAGVYTGEINLVQFANPGTSMTVPVRLIIVAASKAFFDNLPGQTSFSFTPSQANPPSQTIVVGNAGAAGTTLNWAVSPSAAGALKWLHVLPNKGTNTGTYTVSVTTKNLPGHGLIPGTYIGQQLLKAKTGNVTIPVAVTVGDPVFVQLPTVTFNTTVGVNPAPQVISVASTSTSLRFTPTAVSAKGGNWLSISPTGNGCCFTPTNVTVIVNASGLAAGTYIGEINVVQFANPGQSMTVPVVLNVNAAGQVPNGGSGEETP
jgi:hypothetical protein